MSVLRHSNQVFKTVSGLKPNVRDLKILDNTSHVHYLIIINVNRTGFVQSTIPITMLWLHQIKLQNSTYCQKFTKCNDLSFGPSCQTVGCLGTNGSCYFDLQNRQDQACSQILDKNNCNQMYLNYKQILCYWSTSCQSLSYSSCSQIENSTLCGLVDPCKWNSTACLPKKCSDQSVNECQSIYALETSTYTYCRLQTTKVTNTTWNQTCVDSNPLTLNLQNCYIGSAYQFSWNLTSKACAPCITIPKFAYIISYHSINKLYTLLYSSLKTTYHSIFIEEQFYHTEYYYLLQQKTKNLIMSKFSYQVQYVQKDQEYKNFKSQNQNQRDFNQRNSYHKPYPQRLKRVVQYEYKQINQPDNYVYDAQSILNCYKANKEPPAQIVDIMTQIPFLFSKTPQGPVSNEVQKSFSDEEPDWMQETTFNGDFEIKDIEQEIETRRIDYQKSHGTFEKKQEEKKTKEVPNTDDIEAQRQKYRKQKEEQEKQKQKELETQKQLEQLFNLQISIQPEIKAQKVLTVEEVEKNQLNADEDIAEMLGLTIEKSQYRPIQPPPNQRIIPQETIKKKPFSAQAILNSVQTTEKCWYYIDKNDNIQGGFCSNDMDIWFQQGYLMPDLLISWKQPNRWVFLEQFQLNLELVSQSKLPQDQAMEPQIDAQKTIQKKKQMVRNNQNWHTQNDQQKHYPKKKQYNKAIYSIGSRDQTRTTSQSMHNSGFNYDKNDFPQLQ
ncbi:hypothetical protein pb186bvf_003591 [Paramecium bursaria]